MNLISFLKDDYLLPLDSLTLRKILSMQNYVNYYLLLSSMHFFFFFYITCGLCFNCLGFQSLDSFSFISPPKNTTNIHETTLELDKNINLETNYENKNEKSEICINSTNMCTSNKYDLSNNFTK